MPDRSDTMAKVSGESSFDAGEPLGAEQLDPVLEGPVGGDDQPQDETVWERWATKNALDFLNLAPRLNGAGMTRLEEFYDGTLVGGPRPGGEAVLPAWWPDLKCYYRDREPPDDFDDVILVTGGDTIPDADYQDVPCLREEAERERWGQELRKEMDWPEDEVPRLHLTETEFVVEDDEQYNIIAEHFPDENAVTIDLRTHEVDLITGDVLTDAAGNKKRSKRLGGRASLAKDHRVLRATSHQEVQGWL